ncbi:unnamed protein product [Parascedosporium putredinis]|uniref:Cyanovirin-N domain-containing protein n=1 Tax=Parascedosporium putredinis TaxID=1442378 RepID=A0A9P1GWU0_9PEZI|nr:unnamed protein product [Parascedosporium putredinis]CAI7989923.1 unnamed protein product [Parascedosporium putredinis]
MTVGTVSGSWRLNVPESAPGVLTSGKGRAPPPPVNCGREAGFPDPGWAYGVSAAGSGPYPEETRRGVPPPTGALASSVAAQGVVDGFWETCTRWQLGFENETLYRHFMVAECLDDDNKLRTSFISLNDCLSNQEGDLTAKQE